MRIDWWWGGVLAAILIFIKQQISPQRSWGVGEQEPSLNSDCFIVVCKTRSRPIVSHVIAPFLRVCGVVLLGRETLGRHPRLFVCLLKKKKKSRSAPFIFGSRWVARPMQITGEKRHAGRLGAWESSKSFLFFCFLPRQDLSRERRESKGEKERQYGWQMIMTKELRRRRSHQRDESRALSHH